MKRLILILSVCFFMINRCSCYKPSEPKTGFERNPNLELFLSSGSEYYYFPFFSKDGKKVFCITKTDTDPAPYSFPPGYHLIIVDVDSKNVDTLVKNDDIWCYTLPHHGKEITYYSYSPTSELVTIGTDSFYLIREIPLENIEIIIDMHYTQNDSALIFLDSNGGIYYINLYSPTPKESLLFYIETTSFTLHPLNDSLIFFKDLWFPVFDPLNYNEVYGSMDAPGSLSPTEEIVLLRLDTNKRVNLNSKPYKNTDIGRIDISPSGDELIFSATKPRKGIFRPLFDRQELWILHLK